jgi:hypothetical protein
MREAVKREGKEGLNIIGGDFNETNNKEDRRRDKGIKTKIVGKGRVLNIIESADYTDTHGPGGTMTNKMTTNEEKNLRTESRIDRIYAKGTTHLEVTDKTVIVPIGIATSHRMVITRMQTEHIPEENREQEEKKNGKKRVPNLQNQTTNRLEKLARKVTNKCKPREKEWLRALQEADKDVEKADKAAREIITTFLREAKNHLGIKGETFKTNKGKKAHKLMTELLRIREEIKQIIQGRANPKKNNRTKLFRRVKKVFQET